MKNQIIKNLNYLLNNEPDNFFAVLNFVMKNILNDYTIEEDRNNLE